MSPFKWLQARVDARALERRLACLQALRDLGSEQGATAHDILEQARTYSRLVAVDSINATLHNLRGAGLIAIIAQPTVPISGTRRDRRQPLRFRITSAGNSQLAWYGKSSRA